jgi:hypothetical protein
MKIFFHLILSSGQENKPGAPRECFPRSPECILPPILVLSTPEEIRFRNYQILDTNFNTYEIPRFSWVPEIQTVLVENSELPSEGGAGSRPSSHGRCAGHGRMRCGRRQAAAVAHDGRPAPTSYHLRTLKYASTSPMASPKFSRPNPILKWFPENSNRLPGTIMTPC